MRGMLVNDIKAVVKLYQPVSVKYLTNQFIFCADIPFQKVLLKQIELLRFFCGSSRVLLPASVPCALCARGFRRNGLSFFSSFFSATGSGISAF